MRSSSSSERFPLEKFSSAELSDVHIYMIHDIIIAAALPSEQLHAGKISAVQYATRLGCAHKEAIPQWQPKDQHCRRPHLLGLRPLAGPEPPPALAVSPVIAGRCSDMRLSPVCTHVQICICLSSLTVVASSQVSTTYLCF